jgi:hypothetical protein
MRRTASPLRRSFRNLTAALAALEQVTDETTLLAMAQQVAGSLVGTELYALREDMSDWFTRGAIGHLDPPPPNPFQENTPMLAERLSMWPRQIRDSYKPRKSL